MNKIRIHLIVLSTSLLLCSCKNESVEDKEMIRLFQNNTEQLNDVLENSTAKHFNSLKQKSENPQTMSVAYQWFEKADKVKRYAKNISKYIDQIMTNSSLGRNTVDSLYTISLVYQKEITKLDPDVSELLEKDFLFISNLFTQIGIEKGSKANTSFEKLGELEQTNFLGLLKSRTMYMASKVIRHYDEVNTSFDIWHYSTYSSLVTQNTKIVEPEGEVEINAGIGIFSIAAKPTITINGTVVPLNDEGFALFKNKAPKSPGNYTVPVQISFFNQATGKNEAKQINIEYKVLSPCE